MYINNAQQILRTGQRPDSFSWHFVKHLTTFPARRGLRTMVVFKVAAQVNPIGAMRTLQ